MRPALRLTLLAGLMVPSLALGQAKPSSLRSAVDHAMAGKHGTAVALDVASGRLLASYHLDVAARRLAYPGSSIKTFTLLALLEAGAIDADVRVACKRPLNIGGHKLDCSHPDMPQPLGAATALAYSCNSYFTTVATRLTPEQLRDNLVSDGFTSATGFAQNEAVGAVAQATTREQLQLQAVGAWGVRVTPLELLRAYRNVALLASGDSTAKLAPVFAGLEGSTQYGMARLAQPDQGIRVAGKTGTANADDGAWTHGWFAGFAPASKPEIVLVVFLEKGRGSDAAEVAQHIFAAWDAAHSAKPATFEAR